MAKVGRFLRIFNATQKKGCKSRLFAGLIFVFGLFHDSLALNPIHEASYNLIARNNFKSATTLSAGAIIRSQEQSVWEIPLALALKASPRIELGARLQTQWGDEKDKLPYLVFGAKWLVQGQTSLQADFLVGANRNTGKGFSFSSHHKFHYTSWFYSRLVPRIGFMEALVQEDALAALELGYFPTLIIARSIQLECGLISSSQTKSFEKHLAMDLQPAVHVNFGRQAELASAVAFGLAGNRKEDMRVKVVLNYGL